MKILYIVTIICFTVLAVTGSLWAGDISGGLQRPTLQCDIVEGACIPALRPIYATVGDLVEIDVSLMVVPGAPTDVQVSFSHTGVLRHTILGKKLVNGGPFGALGTTTEAWFFQAARAGSAVIVVRVDEQEFEYDVTVAAKKAATAPAGRNKTSH